MNKTMQINKTMKIKSTAAQWLTGMTLASTANAALVQINLTDGLFDSTNVALNNGTFDVGLDLQPGNASGSIFNAGFGYIRLIFYNGGSFSSTTVASADYRAVGTYFASVYRNVVSGGTTPQTATGFLPVLLTHSAINGGVQTSGFIEVDTFSLSTTLDAINFRSVIFDDTDPNTRPPEPTAGTPPTLLGSIDGAGNFTPVPEPSGLSLLALGVAGVMLRRNRKGRS